MDALVAEQLSQKLKRCGLVTPHLDQNVQRVALVVDRALKLHAMASDLHHHRVQMPAVRWPLAASTEAEDAHYATIDAPLMAAQDF